MRSFDAYYRDGEPNKEVLSSLQQLPGAEVEALALQKILGAPANSVLTGAEASKSELKSRNADGRLAQVRVLLFATHGLLAGDIEGLSEPALVLARGPSPRDELLTATDAATLKLRSDWVLLSACDTAAADEQDSDGIAAFARSFFYAGAHSLLVSHWRLRDSIAARLLPDVIQLQQQNPGMSKAEALRRATLSILDDPKTESDSPATWGPFVLVGEPN